MILLGCLAGLRVSEIATLHTNNIIDGTLRVTGKGGHVRSVPVHEVVDRELALVLRG